MKHSADTDVSDAFTETLEHFEHVSTRLHRDETRVVLLVHPHQKRLAVVVEDASAVGPVARHAGTEKEGRDGFVEEEVVLNELLLLLVGHGGEGEVLALVVAL